jgi:hypothetical protein
VTIVAAALLLLTAAGLVVAAVRWRAKQRRAGTWRYLERDPFIAVLGFALFLGILAWKLATS